MDRKRKRNDSPQFISTGTQTTNPDPITTSADKQDEKKLLSTGTVLPLTAANLCLFDPTMNKPATPNKRTAPGSTASTPGPSLNQNVYHVRTLLEQNHLVIENNEAAERCSHVIDKAREIISGERYSAMKTVSQKKAVDTRNRLATRNELTFMVQMWKYMIREEREVHPSNSEGKVDTEIWVARTWEHDHLDTNLDEEFESHSIPALDVGKDLDRVKLYNAIFSTHPKVKNPKPDMAFGLMRSAFTDDQRLMNYEYSRFAEISPGIFHTFFVVEGKGSGGSMEQAENQACRGGAAVVDAMRQLILASKKGVVELGADPRSMAFSLVMIPSGSQIAVHWAEVTKDGTFFHMHTMGRYHLTEKEDHKRSRRDIDNILDWGVLERKKNVCAILDTIKQLVMAEPSESSPKKSKRS